MKKQKDYSLLLIVIILGLAAIGSMGCKGSRHINHKDSTECAVFEGYPVNHTAYFETEAIFIPVEAVSAYGMGETVWIDTNGFVSMPIRDAESNQMITDGLQEVVINARVLPNKYILIK